ncbi:MAG: NUDIX domain-containing protein [Patescibacteria group bacterium]|nr:NUDIX domain-containing protein [Patescibacteria group bacterium]MDD4304405.1 NUDIX domain-containing protein [Patescibacteria group bacterium]MDD4695428.1 NUDIX domain-containing protein [Patescibacteria group bacterium]
MAYYNKIGLLVLSKNEDSFLVCEPGEKYEDKSVVQYLMPGGQFEKESDIKCLQREIKEELNCEIDIGSIKFINEYTDIAATPGKDVMIKLYIGKLVGEPVAHSEIGSLHWISKNDINNEKVSPIIRNKIIPDLINKNILK